MNKSFILFLLVSSLCPSLFSQPVEDFLVSIPLDNVNDRQFLQTLHLPIYHVFDRMLMTILSEENAAALKAKKIPYRIIDPSMKSGRYYLLTKKRGASIVRDPLPGELFSEGKTSVIKINGAGEPLFDRSQYSGVELQRSIGFYTAEQVIAPSFAAADNDSLIRSVIAEVNQDTIRAYVQAMQNFGTRYLLAPNRDSVARWLQRQFVAMGYADVRIDSFQVYATWQKNVTATLPGSVYPEQAVVIGGHHDSYSNTNIMITAPGADDNASGTMAVLEIARVVKKKGYLPKATIKFVTFAAEELGLFGGKAFADKARAEGLDIQLMINHDMIAQTKANLASSKVNINYYSGSEYARDLAISLSGKYTVLSAMKGELNSGGSDSYMFWKDGFPSVYFEEFDFSTYYHTPQDLVSNCKFDYCAEVIRASCSLALTVANNPMKPNDFTAVDAGDGKSVILRWKKNSSRKASGFKISIGKATSVYDTSFTTTDTLFFVRNLTAGIRYYIGVGALNDAGVSGFIIEQSAVPNLKPLPPSNPTALSQWHKIRMQWSPNRENDFYYYNVYRAPVNGTLVKVNSAMLKDTVFTDSSALNGATYDYSVTAVDSALNESSRSASVRSAAVSLDQGVLLVEGTHGGDGSGADPMKPEVSQFYRSLLSKFPFQRFDADSAGIITLANLGPYSSVVLHMNDRNGNPAISSSLAVLQQYLQFGGKIFISSYRPGMVFGLSTSSQATFMPGQFIYDWLKIAGSEYASFSKFVGGIPVVPGYPVINTDTLKTSSIDKFHIQYIDGIHAAPGGTVVYTYNTLFDSTDYTGKMIGKPVGVEYSGPGSKSVVISFPLYFMNSAQAKNLMEYVLVSRFSERTSTEIENKKEMPNEYSIMQNYPNPFNGMTCFSFRLKEHQTVALKIFSVLGSEVSTVVNERMGAGEFTVQWNSGPLPTGVYFYRFQAGNFSESKKMMIVR